MIDGHCAHCEELLFERLEGGLGPRQQRVLHDHLARCRRCRELAAELNRHDSDQASPGERPPAGLVAGVLARTVGSTCDRVRERLAADCGRPVQETERELLSLHLQSCPRCRATARTLHRLGRDLPGLAEMAPDPRFVADVLAATTGATRPTFWERFVARPRLVLESAYVGALALFLVAGTSFSPLQGVVTEGKLHLRHDAAAVQRVVVVRIGTAARAGEAAWGQVQDLVATARANTFRWLLARSRLQALSAAPSMPTALSAAWDRILQRPYERTRDALHQAWHGDQPVPRSPNPDLPKPPR